MAPPPKDPNPPERDPSQPAPDGRRRPAHSDNKGLPALRRTVVRPAGTTPDPVDAAFVATRLTTLTHELCTLLDGSLRVIGLARRSLATDGDTDPDRGIARREACPEHLVRQLETVDAAMRQMAELVRSSMIGMAEGGMAGVRPGFGSSSTLHEAIRHAVDVMAPLAEECTVRLDAHIGLELTDIAAGPIYAVIVNGVRNAIESIQRLGPRYAGGCVIVRAWIEPGRTGKCVMLTIEDDGEGLMGTRPGARPAFTPTKGASAGSVFRLGFTTKPGGSGIGLSLSRDVVEQLGGTIELLGRPTDPHTGRGGAVLSICYPVPKVKMVG